MPSKERHRSDQHRRDDQVVRADIVVGEESRDHCRGGPSAENRRVSGIVQLFSNHHQACQQQQRDAPAQNSFRRCASGNRAHADKGTHHSGNQQEIRLAELGNRRNPRPPREPSCGESSERQQTEVRLRSSFFPEDRQGRQHRNTERQHGRTPAPRPGLRTDHNREDQGDNKKDGGNGRHVEVDAESWKSEMLKGRLLADEVRLPSLWRLESDATPTSRLCRRARRGSFGAGF